jgi:hypothetical protein
VAKVNPSGNAFVFSTYLGGSGTDLGTSIAADSSGNAYVGGYAKSTGFPTAHAIQPTNPGGFDAFVAKISGDGSALLYTTYLGGTANESIFDAGYSGTCDIGTARRIHSDAEIPSSSAPFSRALLVGLVATKVYSAAGADIVMESISLTTPITANAFVFTVDGIRHVFRVST